MIKFNLPKKRLTKLALVLFASLNVSLALGQQKNSIKGTVTDENGKPIAGVTVQIVGTNLSAQTDNNGVYEIKNTSANQKVSYSYIGFLQQEYTTTTTSSSHNVTLVKDPKLSDEVIVSGYGTQKKKDITGSVAIVDMKDAKKTSTNDVGNMLQGRVAGLTVTSDGQPGAFPQVKLRGVSTFNNSDPLYVVDGLALSGVPRELNPNDIESLQVLKDASAGAIYGSRAANGVIIITTKGGKKDMPLQVDYSAYYGVDKIWQIMPVTNAHNYQVMNNEARYNSNNKQLAPGNDPTSSRFITDVDTDWQKEGLKNGMRHNQNVNFTGGGKNSTYMVSLDMFQNRLQTLYRSYQYDTRKRNPQIGSKYCLCKF